MKTEKRFALLSAAVVLGIGLSASALAGNEAVNTHAVAHVDHAGLAAHHDRLAKEMHAKISEKQELLKAHPSTSFFGRNGKSRKARVTGNMNEYRRIALESREKAAYHSAMAAEQAAGKHYVQPAHMRDAINKARIRTGGQSGL